MSWLFAAIGVAAGCTLAVSLLFLIFWGYLHYRATRGEERAQRKERERRIAGQPIFREEYEAEYRRRFPHQN